MMRIHRAFFAAVIVLATTIGTTTAQVEQKLIPPIDLSESIGYGWSVAVDGNYGFVGAAFYDQGLGSVMVFEWNGTEWVFSDSLKSSDAVSFAAFGIYMEADDGVLAVAAPWAESGAVYVFRLIGGQWLEEAKLTSDDVDETSDYAEYIDVSGNRVIVGAPSYSGSISEMGAAFIYEYDGSSWSETAKLTLPTPVAEESFGEGVQIDGDVALIRAREPDRVFVYRLLEDTWQFEEEFSDPSVAFYGEAMAIQEDVLVIGGPGANDEKGTAFVYRHDGIGWQFEQELTPSVENADFDGNFGARVDLSGQFVAISSPTVDLNGQRSGAAFVFEESEGVWTETALLQPSDGDSFHQFGFGLDFSGSSIFVSSAEGFEDFEAAYAFEIDCSALVGKRRVECECVAEEWTYIAGDFGSLTDPTSWNLGTSPDENSLMVFPIEDSSYVVIPGGGETGAMFVEADLEIAASGSGIPTFASPCGESIVVQGRANAEDPGSSLNLIGATIAVDGNIVVPGAPGTVGEINLIGSRLESAESILVDLGNLDSVVGMIIDEGSSWVTPLAAINVGGGSLFVDDRSVVNTRTLELEDAFITLSDSSSITADSVHSASDIVVSDLSAIYTTSLSLSSDSTLRLIVSDTSLVETNSLVVSSSDTATVIIDSSSVLATVETVEISNRSSGYAEILLRGEMTDDEGKSFTTVGAIGEGLLDIEEGGHASLGLVFVGVGTGATGNIEIDGVADDSVSAFEATYLAIGGEGAGFVSAENALFDVRRPDSSSTLRTVELGTSSTGDGTLQLINSLASIDHLIAGTPGRGDVQVTDTTFLITTFIVLGDSISSGGFGSMTVDSSSAVSSLGMCVGCIDGVGVLGVDGHVTTQVLQIGRNGSIRGNVARVQLISTNKTARPDSFSVVTTEALYLSDGATVDIDSLFVEDGTLGGTFTWPTDFTNIGTISPGDSAQGIGTFTIDADYVQTSSGTYLAEIAGATAGTEHDVLAVSGDATIDGVLKVEPVSGFVPNVGDRFRVLTASSVTGTFASVVSDAFEVTPIYEADGLLVEIVSTVGVEDEPTAAEFNLEPNYPNPFSDKTQISYSLEGAGEVQLDLFDLFGRRVAVLVDGSRPAGVSTIEVDGSRLASGTYIYRLKAGDNIATRTLTIIR